MRLYATLTSPGSWLAINDLEEQCQIESLVHLIGSHLCDATVAVNLFEDVRAAYLAEDPQVEKDARVRHLEGCQSFIHARTFVLALDGVDNALQQMERHPHSREASVEARRKLRTVLPHLVHLRDSVQHIDERVQSRARGRSITPQGTGGWLMFDNLQNYEYSTIMADGRQGTIEIAPQTLIRSVEIVQAMIDRLSWRPGSPHVYL